MPATTNKIIPTITKRLVLHTGAGLIGTPPLTLGDPWTFTGGNVPSILTAINSNLPFPSGTEAIAFQIYTFSGNTITRMDFGTPDTSTSDAGVGGAARWYNESTFTNIEGFSSYFRVTLPPPTYPPGLSYTIQSNPYPNMLSTYPAPIWRDNANVMIPIVIDTGTNASQGGPVAPTGQGYVLLNDNSYLPQTLMTPPVPGFYSGSDPAYATAGLNIFPHAQSTANLNSYIIVPNGQPISDLRLFMVISDTGGATVEQYRLYSDNPTADTLLAGHPYGIQPYAMSVADGYMVNISDDSAPGLWGRALWIAGDASAAILYEFMAGDTTAANMLAAIDAIAAQPLWASADRETLYMVDYIMSQGNGVWFYAIPPATSKLNGPLVSLALHGKETPWPPYPTARGIQ